MGSSGSTLTSDSDSETDRRCFGKYRCSKCRNSWVSAYSWTITSGQKCKRCHTMVRPYKQTPLESPEGLDELDSKKRHPQNLCEKCKSLGYYCGNLR